MHGRQDPSDKVIQRRLYLQVLRCIRAGGATVIGIASTHRPDIKAPVTPMPTNTPHVGDVVIEAKRPIQLAKQNSPEENHQKKIANEHKKEPMLESTGPITASDDDNSPEETRPKVEEPTPYSMEEDSHEEEGRRLEEDSTPQPAFRRNSSWHSQLRQPLKGSHVVVIDEKKLEEEKLLDDPARRKSLEETPQQPMPGPNEEDLAEEERRPLGSKTTTATLPLPSLQLQLPYVYSPQQPQLPYSNHHSYPTTPTCEMDPQLPESTTSEPQNRSRDKCCGTKTKLLFAGTIVVGSIPTLVVLSLILPQVLDNLRGREVSQKVDELNWSKLQSESPGLYKLKNRAASDYQPQLKLENLAASGHYQPQRKFKNRLPHHHQPQRKFKDRLPHHHQPQSKRENRLASDHRQPQPKRKYKTNYQRKYKTKR